MVNKTNNSASFRCFFVVRPQNYCYRNALILGKRGDRNNDVGMLENLIDVGCVNKTNKTALFSLLFRSKTAES